MSTNDRDYGAQVVGLTEEAFKNLAKAGTEEAKGQPEQAAARRLHATLQIQTAQAAAILGLASEVRAVGLLLAAGQSVTPSTEVAQEAFTAAAIMLGLVEAEPEPPSADTIAALKDALAGKDPADAPVEL